MTSPRAELAAQALLDDCERTGSALTPEHVDRVLARRKLSPQECLEVYSVLESNDVLSDTEEESSLDGVEELVAGVDVNEESAVGGGGAAGQEEQIPEPDPERLRTTRGIGLDHDLLNGQEEVDCGRAISLGLNMASAVKAGQVPTSKHSQDVIARGMAARDKLIRSNLRLVLKVAIPYSRMTSLEVDDLFQEGVLGLIRAAEKFDPSKGFRFTTYAYYWIYQSITRSLYNQGDQIRLPVHIHHKLTRLRRAVRALIQHNAGRLPSIRQLADEVHWKPEEVQFYLDLSRVVTVSLDAPSDRGEDQALVDTLVATSPGPEQLIEEDDLHAHVVSVLETLPSRDRDVIVRRFGFNDKHDRQTLEDIGEQYGLTRERIRQIETRVLTRLKGNHDIQELKDLIDF